MINFQYEHPETYKDFSEYQESFYQYFQGMMNDKVLVLNATKNVVDFIKKFNMEKTHKIVLFKNNSNKESADFKTDYLITDHVLTGEGNKFKLKTKDKSHDFFLPFLPGYMIYNATGAIIASLELGLDIELIKKNILKFNGMVRRRPRGHGKEVRPGGGAVLYRMLRGYTNQDLEGGPTPSSCSCWITKSSLFASSVIGTCTTSRR